METRELFQKFYPNTDIKMAELYPQFDNHKSFYGKARIVEIENDIFLVSYDTVVAFYNKNARIPKVYDTYSATTLRHIKEFLKQNGFVANTLSQIKRDYM